MRLTIFVLVLCQVMLGCGDTSPPPGALDASLDSGAGDAAQVDARGSDAATDVPTDVPSRTDAGDPNPLSGCTFGDVEELSLSGSQRSSGVQLAATSDGFGVVYSASPEGPENVYFRFVPLATAAGAPVLITNDNNITRSPSITPFGTGFLISWYDNDSGGFEIRSQVIARDGTSDVSPFRLSDNLFRDDAPALVTLPAGALALWVEDDDQELTRVLRGTRLDDAGAPTGGTLALTDATTSVDRPLARSMGTGAFVVWGQGNGTGRNAFGLFVNADGSAGSPVVLSEEGGVGNLAFATNETAALAYNTGGGSAGQVWVQPIGMDGVALGEAQLVNSTGDEGGAPALASFEEGYVAAFPARSEGEVVRLIAVDAEGHILGSLDGPALSGDIGVLSMASEGRTMMLTWGITELRSMKITCP